MKLYLRQNEKKIYKKNNKNNLREKKSYLDKSSNRPLKAILTNIDVYSFNY